MSGFSRLVTGFSTRCDSGPCTPGISIPQGLVALWREALLARAVLRGKTRGYRHHPQLHRFRASATPVVEPQPVSCRGPSGGNFERISVRPVTVRPHPAWRTHCRNEWSAGLRVGPSPRQVEPSFTGPISSLARSERTGAPSALSIVTGGVRTGNAQRELDSWQTQSLICEYALW